MPSFFSEHDLPFGVRILNAFLTLSEYLNLYDALAQSAYRQPSRSESSGTFPDLYVTSSSPAGNRDSSSRQIDASDGKHLSTNVLQVSSEISGNSDEGITFTVSVDNSTENSAEEVRSATPVDNRADGEKIQDVKRHTNGDFDLVDQKLPESLAEPELNSPLDAKPSSVEHTDEQDVDIVKTSGGESETLVNDFEENNEGEMCESTEKRDGEEHTDNNGSNVTDRIEVINPTAAYDSSCESGLSNDVSLTMEAVDVEGLKVVEYFTNLANYQGQEQQSDEETNEIKPSTSCLSSLTNSSNCKTSESITNDDDIDICCVVLEDLITKVVAMVEEGNSDLESKGSGNVVGFGACCQMCADAQKSRDVSSGDAKPCGSQENASKDETTESLTDGGSSSVKHDAGTKIADFSPDIEETIPCKSDSNDSDEASCRSPKPADVTENSPPIEVNSSKDNNLRSELIKTPIVCDSFSIRNLNVASEKFLEKSFACVDTCSDTEIQQSQPDRPWSEVGTMTLSANGHSEAVDGISVTASFISVESDSEIYVGNGHEGVPSSEGIELPVDPALEEVEGEDESPEWFEPPLGDVLSSSLPDIEGEEQLLFEEEGGGDDVNQVRTNFVNLLQTIAD